MSRSRVLAKVSNELLEEGDCVVKFGGKHRVMHDSELDNFYYAKALRNDVVSIRDILNRAERSVLIIG